MCGAARNGIPVPVRKMDSATRTTAAEKLVLARAAERGAKAVADKKGTAATWDGTGAGSRDATETRGAAKKKGRKVQVTFMLKNLGISTTRESYFPVFQNTVTLAKTPN